MSQDYSKKTKTRHLTAYEFYEQIQIEYICSVLRARIYPKPSDKDYWNKVAEGKKQVINKIADRNKLPSIFTDSDLEAALNRRVFREDTFPIFTYRDETHKLSQEYFDLLYYYFPKSDIRYDIGLGVQIGKVKSYKPFDKTVEITTEEGSLKIEVAKVARIL